MRTPWIISATEFLRNSVGAFAAVIAIGLAAPAFAQGVDHKQQIEKIIAAYREAWNSHNAAGIAALYTKDGILVTQSPQVVKNGTQEIEQSYEATFKAGTVNDSATADQIVPLGTDAVMSVGQYHLTAKGQDGPTKIDGHWTAVYVNDGG